MAGGSGWTGDRPCTYILPPVLPFRTPDNPRRAPQQQIPGPLAASEVAA